MPRFVALLRGVNVGGSRRVAMADLRRAMESAGFLRVRTYLQSGNVVFDATGADAPHHAAQIAAILVDEVGHEVEVLVLTCTELKRIQQRNPFAVEAGNDSRSVHALLLFAPVEVEAFVALQLPAAPGEEAVLGDGAIYLHLPNGYGRSKLTGTFFEHKLNVPASARNWRTVLALRELCESR